ncbi:MAG: CpaD family pilus assembly protein [Beijerinckiaceae bacterium]
MPRSVPNRILDRTPPSARLQAALLACVASLLAGCGTTDRTVTSSIPMDDYRNRHPIVLAETPRSLDIFPSFGSHGLDLHSVAQVRDFARAYHRDGHGAITVLVPARGAAFARGEVEGVRRTLAAERVTAPLNVTTYPIVNPALASPIRLSFVGLKAKVADRCGQWPNDLASGSSLEGWENKPYWNFGCSTQAALAAQIADPRDLVAPTGEDPADTLMRSRAIAALRKGTDPDTDWKTKATSISNLGN